MEVYLVMLLVGSISAPLFGLAPIWQVARQDIETALRERAGAVTGSRQQQKFRDVLVAAQLNQSMMYGGSFIG